MQLSERFVDSMRALLGDGASQVLNAIAEEPIVSVRLNPSKCGVMCPSLDRVPWASDAYYLPERVPFTFDPLFHAGCYYVQEASSMFLQRVVDQYVNRPVTALDLCAAPGGKSTHLLSSLPAGSLLVSNELIPNRASVLVENIVKWGYPNAVVTNNAPSDFSPFEGLFDLIVTDVPCSGEGMFRKDPVAVSEWSENNVETCWRRGRDILSDCWPSLKEGGYLVYSTCTFNVKEDEENVRWICNELGAEVLPVDTEDAWGITGNLLPDEGDGMHFPVYHFLPGRTRGEGFFLVLLRKTSSSKSFVLRADKKKKRTVLPSLPVPDECRRWLKEQSAFAWRILGNVVTAVPAEHMELVAFLEQHLRVLHAGVCVAEMKGHDVFPSPLLASSLCLARDVFPQCELTYDEALSYLRKESFPLSSEQPKGYVLLTFHCFPLGFVKNLGSRANNLYPTEWRIRTTHLPDKMISVLP